MKDIMELCEVVRETGFAIHCFEIKKYALTQPAEPGRLASLVVAFFAHFAFFRSQRKTI